MGRGVMTKLRDVIVPLEGVELRPAVCADAAALYEAVDRNRAHLRPWFAWVEATHGEGDILRHLEERERENASRASFAAHIWVKGVLSGAISLHTFHLQHRHTSIGYWLDAAYEGRGIMTASCRAMVCEGFATYGMHRIEIRCATENHKSSAIPKRLGFVEEGVLREAELLCGKWTDLRVFAMLQQDWKSRGT